MILYILIELEIQIEWYLTQLLLSFIYEFIVETYNCNLVYFDVGVVTD